MSNYIWDEPSRNERARRRAKRISHAIAALAKAQEEMPSTIRPTKDGDGHIITRGRAVGTVSRLTIGAFAL